MCAGLCHKAVFTHSGWSSSRSFCLQILTTWQLIRLSTQLWFYQGCVLITFTHVQWIDPFSLDKLNRNLQNHPGTPCALIVLLVSCRLSECLCFFFFFFLTVTTTALLSPLSALNILTGSFLMSCPEAWPCWFRAQLFVLDRMREFSGWQRVSRPACVCRTNAACKPRWRWHAWFYLHVICSLQEPGRLPYFCFDLNPASDVILHCRFSLNPAV